MRCRSDDVGTVLRLARVAARMTQAEVGECVGYSASAISRLETGRRKVDWCTIRQLMQVLRIPPEVLGLDSAGSRHDRPSGGGGSTTVLPQTHDEASEDAVRRRRLLTLTGQAATGLAVHTAVGGASAGATEPDVTRLEDALVYGLPSASGHAGRASVARSVAGARRDFAAGRYAELVDALPGRLALADTAEGELSQRALATLYGIAARTATKLGRDALVMVTADRALAHARGSGDPLLLAEAQRMVSLGYRRGGQYERALEIAVRAADGLDADRAASGRPHTSTLGTLYATAAYTAARAGDGASARELMGYARARVAAQAGAPADGAFDVRHAALYGVSVYQRLGDPASAVAAARMIDTRGLSSERTARLCIDVARAHADWGRPRHCFQALLAAERASPQEVRRNVVRAVVRDLLRHNVNGLREFARRTGALAA